MSKWAVCLATIRPDLANIWLSKWSQFFTQHNVDVYIMQDINEKTIMPRESVYVFDHSDIEKDLGDLAHAIPRKTGACRSYAMLRAYRKGYDYYLTLDDDCFPVDDTIQAYEDHFKPQYCPHYNYVDISALLGYQYQLRGYPYTIRKTHDIAAQYGVWLKIADYDAITSIEKDISDEMNIKRTVSPVPKYSGFTACIMNVAISHKYLPVMYQLLMGKAVGYDRFDDIWSGLLLKKITDHFEDVVLINGSARILHDRASNPYNNLMKELPAMAKNETIWKELLNMELTGTTPLECYKELANSNILPDQKRAMLTWTTIIEQQSSHL